MKLNKAFFLKAGAWVLGAVVVLAQQGKLGKYSGIIAGVLGGGGLATALHLHFN